MIGLIRMVRRLMAAKRQRSRRITIIESAHEPLLNPSIGSQVARVMGWKHLALTSEETTEVEIPFVDVVISRPAGYGGENSQSRDFDGLTVCVDDVCDLSSGTQKNTYQERDFRSLQVECLRRVMRALERKGGRS